MVKLIKRSKRSTGNHADAGVEAGARPTVDPCAKEPLSGRGDAPVTGVVFVHGVGTQPERETLDQWANPVIEMLTEWRRGQDQDCPDPDIGFDPVVGAAIGDRSWVELRIPARQGRPEGRWLLTEAYWAGDVVAPTFTDTFTYLRKRVARVINGIAAGYGHRETARRQRLRTMIDDLGNVGDEQTRALIADLSRSLSWRWRIVDLLDLVWQLKPVRQVLAAAATLGSLTAMAIYAPLRAIPIKAVREKFEQAAFDTWLVEWFGDLPIILDDPIQAALARRRLAESVCWLRDKGAERIVVVAHSGGAIVSFATLLEHSNTDLPVDKLVTLGQGLALGWRLEREGRSFDVANQIRGDLGARRPNLRWVDVWASYDPAPAGRFEPVPGTPLTTAEKSPVPTGSPIVIESRPVTNFMHLAMDHGGYWANDEGFLVPLIRHIDDPTGDGSASRFYGSALARSVRTERRRRRVGLLLAWRWVAFAAGVAAVALAALPPTPLLDTGNAVAAVWSQIPFLNELVSLPFDAVGGIVALLLGEAGRRDVADSLATVGPIILGALVPILAVFTIYSRGVGSWMSADAEERLKIRRELLGPAGSATARSEAILLVGGLVAVVLAALERPAPIVLGSVVVFAVLAAAARLVR